MSLSTEVTTEPLPVSPEAVLHFWFDECRPAQWFRRSQAFDQTIQSRFGGLVEAALEGDLGHWSDSAHSGLALVLLLNQFPRKIWRGQAKAFAGDA